MHSPKEQGRLLRSKGFFWLASRPDLAGQWNQAGGIAYHGGAGLFWQAVPEEEWPEDEESREHIMASWIEAPRRPSAGTGVYRSGGWIRPGCVANWMPVC
ncbi:GTP-binding protein [Oceanimonas sp. NS1]|nr:GTP-binding protein [Oceanimonas sp. NS1]